MGAEEEAANAVVDDAAAGDEQTKSASPESEGEAAADYLEGLLDIIDAIKTLAMLRVEILQREEASVEAAANLRLTYGEYGR